MSKAALLLIHGMGSFDPPKEDNQGNILEYGTFGKEFLNAGNGALQKYPNYKTKRIEEYVDIHEFNYNAFLDDMRNTMVDNAQNMIQRLALISEHANVNFATELAGNLLSLEADFKEEKFFYTHWLDVLFYGTLLGDKIRVDAAAKISEIVTKYGQSNVHIMAHSLGTAVLHDTLHLLYRREHDPDDKIPDLDLTNHKLASVWMLANVSRLVNSVTQLTYPLKSVVKPGNNGCCNLFVNVRHKLDPITWLSRFNPKNNGSWVLEPIYSTYYANIVTDLVVDANTHSFAQYLQNPKVAEKFFFQLIDHFDVSIPEMDKVAAEYSQNSIQGAYASLEDAFHNLQVKDIKSWREFLETAKTFQAAIENVRQGL